MNTKIVFFNHKGGVSKTTTAFHLGWMIAEQGTRVLLVDADPQCNLTGLILGDDFEKYYVEESTKKQNIKDGVSVAFEGKPSPIEAIIPYNVPRNPNLFLLPGHANLSEYDASLSFAQTSNNAITALQNLPGSFNELINKTASDNDIELVIIDLNPGLSAINQNLFIISDIFVIPTNPDPFSVMALNTLANVLPKWVDWADRMRTLFLDSAYPLPDVKPKLAGIIIQRFNVRKGKPSTPYLDNINEIREVVKSRLALALNRVDMLFEEDTYKNANIPADLCLIEIPDFQALLPKARDTGVPVFAITDKEINETGVVLEGLIESRKKFREIFHKLAEEIMHLVEYAKSPESV